MPDNKRILQLGATDLAGHLSCNHLTQLDAEGARGARAKPKSWDPLLEILHKRGDLHEQAYLDHLERAGYEIIRIECVGLEEKHAEETVAAMCSGAAIISHGVLSDVRWGDRSDLLRRVDRPSDLGHWSYEVIDTKLAREMTGGSVLQLCLYTELVTKAQGLVPEFMYVVAPWSVFEPQVFRSSGYFAYFRLVRRSLEASVAHDAATQTYPASDSTVIFAAGGWTAMPAAVTTITCASLPERPVFRSRSSDGAISQRWWRSPPNRCL